MTESAQTEGVRRGGRTATGVLTLTDFLLARIAEDEQRARCAGHGCGYLHEHNCGWVEVGFPQAHNTRAYYEQRFIRHHSPARVLAECEAKRGALGLLAVAQDLYERTHLGVAEYAAVQRAEITRDALRRVACYLALPYAAHPDFRQEWRP